MGKEGIVFFFFLIIICIIGFIGLHLQRKSSNKNSDLELTFYAMLIVPIVILAFGLVIIWSDSMDTIAEMRSFYYTNTGKYAEMYSPTTGEFIGINEYNSDLSMYIINRASPFRRWYTPDVSFLGYLYEKPND